MSMKPRQPASAEYTLTQWNQVPVDDPSPAVFGQTKIVRAIGYATESASTAALLRRDASLSAISAASTTNHMRPACQLMSPNKNLSLIHISEPTRLGMISY